MPADSYSPSRSIRLARTAILLTASVVAALLLLPQASALAGEVHFDPESPAGKEYALPLDQAREEAAGVGKTDGPAGEKSPLFGEGVSSGGGGTPGGGQNGDGSGGNTPGGSGQGHPSQADRPPAAVAAAISRNDSSYSFSSAILWIVAFIALSGLAALGLRTLQRPRAT